MGGLIIGLTVTASDRAIRSHVMITGITQWVNMLHSWTLSVQAFAACWASCPSWGSLGLHKHFIQAPNTRKSPRGLPPWVALVPCPCTAFHRRRPGYRGSYLSLPLLPNNTNIFAKVCMSYDVYCSDLMMSTSALPFVNSLSTEKKNDKHAFCLHGVGH